ncbi:MAG: alpha/beta hydrolase [Rectinemataceae bacterium]|nr:alpha/beta hydrolase [Rectinemataceae bacterium]
MMRTLGIGATVFVVLLLILLLVYIATDREKKTLNDDERIHLGGTYLKLSAGITHYELTGPAEGKVVVFVHGFSVAMYNWDLQVQALTRAGFRVLRYDLYGRGYSDRPEAQYNAALFVTQLRDLLDALKITKPVNLVGLSLGGPVVAHFAAAYPVRVERLVLLAPVVKSVVNDAKFKPLRMPVVGNFFMRVIAVKTITERGLALLKSIDASGKYAAMFKAQTEYSGYSYALRSLICGDLFSDQIETYKKAVTNAKRILLLWGTADTDISVEMIARLRGAVPGIEYHELNGIGHDLNYTAADIINPLIIDFLK